MLRAVALQGFAEMTERFHIVLEGKTMGSIEAVSALGTAYVGFAQENPGVFRMMFAASEDSTETEAAGHACYGALLAQIAIYLGREEVDDVVMQTAFPLWTFVHGLSFLMIDGKADFAKMKRSVPDLVTEGTRRLLAESPA